jgi:leader peptidase (prepilin peptidase)/N-methyltransferase
LGDVKFLLAGALWIGLEGLPILLLLAVLSASVSLLILRIGGARLSRSDALSFGPHLAVALWLVWVIGPWRTGGELF